MEHTNILQQVVSELGKRVGDLRRVSEESGISYDTVLRIKNGEGDPSFGRVQSLHDYLCKPTKQAA